jgi:hypothetical protein
MAAKGAQALTAAEKNEAILALTRTRKVLIRVVGLLLDIDLSVRERALVMQRLAETEELLRELDAMLGKRLGMSDGKVDPEAVTRAKRPPDRMYIVGEQLPAWLPLPGIVRCYERGLEWVLPAESLTVRVNWDEA